MKIYDARKGNLNPRQIYEDLAQNAIAESMFHSGRKRWKIGNGLDRLTPEEREAIKNLTSKEALETRFP